MKLVIWWLGLVLTLSSCQIPSCKSYLTPIIVAKDETNLVFTLDGMQLNLKCKEFVNELK